MLIQRCASFDVFQRGTDISSNLRHSLEATPMLLSLRSLMNEAEEGKALINVFTQKENCFQ